MNRQKLIDSLTDIDDEDLMAVEAKKLSAELEPELLAGIAEILESFNKEKDEE